MTGPSHSVTQTQSVSQQPKDAATTADEANTTGQEGRENLLGNTLARWFPLLRIMKLQVEKKHESSFSSIFFFYIYFSFLRSKKIVFYFDSVEVSEQMHFLVLVLI